MACPRLLLQTATQIISCQFLHHGNPYKPLLQTQYSYQLTLIPLQTRLLPRIQIHTRQLLEDTLCKGISTSSIVIRAMVLMGLKLTITGSIDKNVLIDRGGLGSQTGRGKNIKAALLTMAFWSKNHWIIESSRSICGLISFSYRQDNLVPGRFIRTS